jgi:hypothetical protein
MGERESRDLALSRYITGPDNNTTQFKLVCSIDQVYMHRIIIGRSKY